MYIYIYMYMCVYMYIYIYIYIHISFSMKLCISPGDALGDVPRAGQVVEREGRRVQHEGVVLVVTHIYTNICVSIYLSLSLSLYIYIYI